MRLNQKALGQINANQLWMDHLDKLDPFVVYFHYVWIGPVQLLISGWILYEVIGPSCLAGLAVLIVFVLQKSILFQSFALPSPKVATFD